jgi:K+-sensing histidine kinase KdpD
LAHQQVYTKPVKILFEPNTPMPNVVHDPALIQQVVLNILLNGLQAIPKQGQVAVRLKQEAGSEVVEITDTGRGISQEAFPKYSSHFSPREMKERGSDCLWRTELFKLMAAGFR